MIYWLVQSWDACPDLKQGTAPVGFLSTGEQAKLNTLKILKRRREWLLGRWTAKILVRTILYHRGGAPLPLDAWSVLNDQDGVPVVSGNIDPMFSLSISHSCDYALCALVERNPWPIGCDIERIEPRSDTFVRDYLTPDEIARVNCAAPCLRDSLITAVWSAKESVLKALHLGLSVDPYAVACLIDPPTNICPCGMPFTICLDARWLHAPTNVRTPPLAGWWRPFHSFVLSVVSSVTSHVSSTQQKM